MILTSFEYCTLLEVNGRGYWTASVVPMHGNFRRFVKILARCEKSWIIIPYLLSCTILRPYAWNTHANEHVAWRDCVMKFCRECARCRFKLNHTPGNVKPRILRFSSNFKLFPTNSEKWTALNFSRLIHECSPITNWFDTPLFHVRFLHRVKKIFAPVFSEESAHLR